MKRLLAIALSMTAGCDAADFTPSERALLLALTPLDEPPPDPSNQYVGDRSAEALGDCFFHDPDFLGVSSLKDVVSETVPFGRAPEGQRVNISCATCHDLARGGVDHTSMPNQLAIGAGWFNVNAPTVVNAAYDDLYFWNGRVDSMWAVAAVAGEGAVAFNATRIEITRVIDAQYRDRYGAVFEEPLPTDAEIAAYPPRGKPRQPAYDALPEDARVKLTRVYVNWAKALAAYQYTLIQRDTLFDRHMAGTDRMSDEAVRGAKLFVGKAACIECHGTPLFSDQDFHNTGVPESAQAHPRERDCVEGAACDCITPGKKCPPWGAHDGLPKLPNNEFRRDNEWSDDQSDESRKHHYDRDVTGLRGAWRTPSLRNVALTAPYMHDGAYSTLEDAVWHYSIGGTSAGAASDAKSPTMHPLDLDETEVAALVVFLEALTSLDPLPATQCATSTSSGS